MRALTSSPLRNPPKPRLLFVDTLKAGVLKGVPTLERRTLVLLMRQRLNEALERRFNKIIDLRNEVVFRGTKFKEFMNLTIYYSILCCI